MSSHTPNESTPSEELLPSPAELLGSARRYPVLLAASALIGLIATLAWLANQVPQWTAGTTIVLRQEEDPQDAAVAPLHAMVRNPERASELAFLRSAQPATETVRPPSPLDGAWTATHLGLTTVTDDASLQPLEGLKRRVFGSPLGEGRLRAFVDERQRGTPDALLVRFEGRERVRIAPWAPRFAFDERSAETYTFDPSTPIQYGGLRLWLRPEGDVAGKTFSITLHQEREAVRDLMERTTIEEAELGTGVIRVAVRDSDPERAAETANGLVANYLASREQQSRAEANERLGQIESELRRVETDLKAALDELVDLRRNSPLTIDADESSKQLTLDLTIIASEYTGTQLELALVEEAITSLEQGDIAALSRIQNHTTDELTRLLVGQVAKLVADAQLGTNTSAATYVQLLHARRGRLEDSRDRTMMQVGAMTRALAGLRERGTAALGMLGEGGAAAPLTLDPSSTILLETTVRLSAKKTELLAQDYLETHPEVAAMSAAIDENLCAIEENIAGRLELHRRQLDQLEEMIASTQAELDAKPIENRANLEAAIDRFREQIVRNLGSLRDSLRSRAAVQSSQLASIEEQLSEIPYDERRQLGPLQIVENAKGRVAELLETRDTVKMVHAFFRAPAQIVDPATAPARRDTPRTGVALALGTLLGLAAGLVLAFLYDRTRGRVSSERDVEDELGLPVLGTLGDLGISASHALRDLRIDFQRRPKGRTAQAFQEVRENLFTLLAGRSDIRAIGVTAASPGEGKSVTALGVALACRRARRRVLLIDATGVASGRRAAPQPGLVHALGDGTIGKELVVPSGLEGLDLLGAGGELPDVADACSAPEALMRMRALCASYDLVIVELPSLAHSPEATAVARLLSALIVVCEKDGATRDAVRSAIDRLDASGFTLLGAVFNKGARRGRKRRPEPRPRAVPFQERGRSAA